MRIRAGGCPYINGGCGSVTFPVQRKLAPGWEEDGARTSRKMMSNGHLRPGLSSWCQARICCLPARVPREALSSSLSESPREGKVPVLIPDEASWKPHPVLECTALCQTYHPASFPPACSSPREEVGLVGQEGEVLWGGCGGSPTPLAGDLGTSCGAGTSQTPNSTVIQLLSRGPVPSIQFSEGCRFLPLSVLRNAYYVHSIYLHRGKVGKGYERKYTWLTSSCVPFCVASHLRASILPL